MNPEIQKAVEAGKLPRTAAAALEKINPGVFVTHKSWGFGKVDSVNFLLGQITIDFTGKKGHAMQLQYAAESLSVIPDDHVLVHRSENPSGLRERTGSDPAGVVRQILKSFGGKATLAQITQMLVPEILSETDFKRWITTAKNALKKDGHFVIPLKKNDPFELRESAISHADEFFGALQRARQLRDQIAALDLILKNLSEFEVSDPRLAQILALTGQEALKGQRLQPADALTLLLFRDEIVESDRKVAAPENAPTVASFLIPFDRQMLADVLDEIPASKLRRAIAALPEAFGENWHLRAIDLVLRGSTRVVGEAARFLQEKGFTEALRNALSQAIAEHSISDKTLQWLARERSGEFRDLAGVRLLTAIIAALERQQLSEKRDRKLQDLLLGDKDLLLDLIDDASPEEMREVMRRILLATAFEELNKRSLLGRIIREYPDLQSMVSADSGESEESLTVSWPSLEKRKAEYEDLVSKKIPENVKEISVARSYGDLRENFEYKAAKEMQRVLQRRRAEMERDLGRARGTDFSNTDTSKVGIGTQVTLRNVATGSTESYHILGAWDGDPDRHIISYQTAIAQALIGSKPGDQATIPTESGESTVVVVLVELSSEIPVAVSQ